ncbi:MAG: SDR family NAD(P)-dependent oxidoreductase [Phormidesmis sp.]
MVYPAKLQKVLIPGACQTSFVDEPVEEAAMRLSEKVALVTSSSPGICASIARQLASEGACVMICGRNATQGLATVTRIRDRGGRASFTLSDTSVIADAQAAIDETIATYGRLDILFNHANARSSPDGALLEISETVWDRVVETTLKGTFFCCQYALPFLQHSGSGTIINLIEQTPTQPPSQTRSATAICQGGVMAMTRAIAQQFPAQHVTANLIWAMPSSTALAAQAFPLNLATSIIYGPSEDPEAPARAFGDIAEAVMYLAINGETLHGATLVVDAHFSETSES